ncbi:MAG: sigma-54-dependent Fis family transcriptional regulator, partial [Bacteroidota bacterium]|nr:sigma-54-dependent Fis family transcriptional regulator [Bacteroidota bacterium]
AIENGSFREDLYYRISVFQIQLPPLVERLEDIPLFAHHFLKVYALKTKKKIDHISDNYLSALQQHSWKGNIRELKNVIERSVILTTGDKLEVETLPSEFHLFASSSPHKEISAFAMASAEKLHIQKVLNYTHGNKTKAAELLHIALTTLYRKMEEYAIK